MTRLLAGLMLITACAAASAQQTLTAGLRVNATTRIRQGVYRLTDPGEGILQVGGSGYTLDLRGVKIAGPGTNKGTGIHLVGARDVTIRGVDVSGCLWGIVLEKCTNVTLIDCVSSHNGDLPPGTVIDESGREPEDQHGGGFVLRDCTGCKVLRCTAQHEWDGIDVVRSNGNTIDDGDYSYCNNWGLHLWLSSKNKFRRNRAIWCTTGEGMLFQSLGGWQTYDAQAVGIDHASCDNLIEDNDLRFGGDGVFIRANEGGERPGTAVPPKNSSDRNILRRNDCSYSPNNAIEVDFVEGTIIEDNNCSFSHYGMWLGYSRGSIVRGNICLNDTARAIEIENGQNGTFEKNLFGFDEPRAMDALIYLRQNGRDNTPSGPYTIRNNVFYGTSVGILLRNTAATCTDNGIYWTGRNAATLVTHDRDRPGRAAESGTTYKPEHEGDNPPVIGPSKLIPGRWTDIAGPVLAAELGGIPLWSRASSRAGNLAIFMPADFWDRPAPAKEMLRVYVWGRWRNLGQAAIAWPKAIPRVTRVSPNPARIGDSVTVEGENLSGELLLNGKPVTAERAGNRLTFKTPEGILVPTRFNLMVRSGDKFSWPVIFAVEVPRESQPHILSATFSPTTLHVGDVLTVSFTVRNNLPAPALLVTKPAPGFTYEEHQAGWEVGAQEPPGTLHLRVSSDHPGRNHPGSWPWFFGFGQERLAPGETVTVTGRIRVETPGEHEFRVGLVASGFRFIDDNAFRTKITVLPK